MKGIIFELLHQVVGNAYGEDAWDDLLDDSGLTGAYTAVGSYPDEELIALITNAGAKLDREPDELVHWFGSECIPLLATRYPAFFEPHTTTLGFLRTLNEVIHPEVRKLFPGAYAPSFEFEERDDKTLALAYHSHRNLCSFAEGLIDGAAAYYHEDVTVEQPSCAKRGDERCVLVTTVIRSSVADEQLV